METLHKLATTILLVSLAGVLFSTGIFYAKGLPDFPNSLYIFWGIFVITGICKVFFYAREIYLN